MDKVWLKVIKTTGYVGIVAFLFSLLMTHIFNEKIIDILGSQKIFYIVVSLISCFSIALIISITKPKNTTLDSNASVNPKTDSTQKNISINYQNNSTHNGNNNF